MQTSLFAAYLTNKIPTSQNYIDMAFCDSKPFLCCINMIHHWISSYSTHNNCLNENPLTFLQSNTVHCKKIKSKPGWLENIKKLLSIYYKQLLKSILLYISGQLVTKAGNETLHLLSISYRSMRQLWRIWFLKCYSLSQ